MKKLHLILSASLISLLIGMGFLAEQKFGAVVEDVWTVCDSNKPKAADIASLKTRLKVKNIDNSLRELTSKEFASVKGCEIAKNVKSLPRQNIKYSGADYDIEIVEVKPIEGGIEVFARAWLPNGEQIGFGKDGSVDIERFRFFNPPVLVDDPLGTIVREWTDEITGELKQIKLRESPQEAILQSLAHTLKVKRQKHPSANIVKGKVGNTTSTFNPAGGAASPVDGIARASPPGCSTFAALRDATGTTGRSTELSENIALVQNNGCASGSWDNMTRSFFLFDTSTIPDGDTIDSATLSIEGDSVVDNFVQSVGIVQSTIADNASVAAADYEGTITNTTLQAPAIALSAWSTTAFNDFAFNATGLGNISKTSISKFGAKISADYNNSEPAGQASPTYSAPSGRMADTAGTASDPKLVVEHTGAVAGFNSIMIID